MKSYRDLEIYKLSYDLAVKIHNASLKLPQYEIFEAGSQIRNPLKASRHALQKATVEDATKPNLSGFSFTLMLRATRLFFI